MQMSKINAIALVLKGRSHWQWFVATNNCTSLFSIELEIWGNSDDAA